MELEQVFIRRQTRDLSKQFTFIKFSARMFTIFNAWKIPDKWNTIFVKIRGNFRGISAISIERGVFFYYPMYLQIYSLIIAPCRVRVLIMISEW